MIRALTLTSLGLFLLGLELSAETISITAERLLTGTAALLQGAGYAVPPVRFALGLVMVLLGVIVGLSVALAQVALLRVEASGRVCPGCKAETTRVRRKVWNRLLALLVQEDITRRHCDECGWTGLAVGD